MWLTMSKKSIWMVNFLLIAFATVAFGQSNYASHANNVEYQGKGLPEEATLDGKVTKLDELSPIIYLNRTKATLNCGAGSMQVDMKFKEKFFGIVYADPNRNSACKIEGTGELSYMLELPLKGCGTKQDPQRVFTNNIVVRFHRDLEMDGDEIITIVCRYPPPVAPIPAGLQAPILSEVLPSPVIGQPLRGIQILLIICAIMFLTLLLLGLGVSYYCLRRRPVPVVRRLPISLGTGSEITKLSGSSLGNISHFEGLKIPRAHAPLAVVHSSSGSDGLLNSDTIPSDYPSESHSEIEEIDTRSLPVSSAGSYDNRAFVQETSSIYSENYGHTQEFQAANTMAQTSMVPRHPIAVKEQSPKFDVQVRVKRAPPPPPSPLTSDTESLAASRHDRNNLSTIMETHEDRESVLTIDSLPQDVAHSQFTYVPELHAIPKYIEPSSTFNKSYNKQQETRIERHMWPEDLADGPPVSETRSLVSLGTEMTDTHSMSEMLDSSHLYPMTYHSSVQIEQALPEPPIVVKKPQISSHTVDDVFLRTITEKKTIEDIESHKRRITEYKAKSIIDPTWDVTIRNYPTDDQNQQQWENFSDISSASGLTLTPKMERAMNIPPPQYINESGLQLTSPQLVGNMKPIEIPPEDKTVPNWDVLIRVLEDADMPEPDDTTSIQSSAHPLTRQLSYEDKARWKEIITTESHLRTMLTEAVVREDFERIRNDVRYERIFQPQAWDVLIRILAPPEDDNEARAPKRYKKKEAWDTRSRRSSLPTLYEYDSDGGSSVRTIRNDPMPPTNIGYQVNQRSRRASRSSYRSDNVDMRSMSEMTVDFARPDHFDNFSDASSLYRPHYYDEEGYEGSTVQRSISHPSLARSASEFTEHWTAPDHESDISSPDVTPKARRSQRIMTTFQQRPQPPTRNGNVVRTQYMETSRVSTFKSQSNDGPSEW